jgi:nanoRNase/pAp phosphatase (c-di-AMP/oligoRNAs hydrolase)
LAREIDIEFQEDLKDFALSFGNIIQELELKRKKMLTTMHRFLDGDAFGSAVALGLILRKLNIDSTLLCVPFVPEKFEFLGHISRLDIVEAGRVGRENIRREFVEGLQDYFSDRIEDYGALTILDCAGFGQIPKEVWEIGSTLPYKINIDHHVGYTLDIPENGILNLVGNCSSTSEVLFHLMRELGMEIVPKIAVPLYIGVVADLRKNDVSKESSQYPKTIIKMLHAQVRKMGDETERQIKSIFSLDSWEKYLLKMIIESIRFVDNIVHVKFDTDMIFKAKQATDSLHNPKMPFHEFHIRLRQWLQRFRKEFQIVVIFDQLLGKVSLYDLQKNGTFDLASISRELGDGGGHLNRAGFSFHAAKERLMKSDIIEDDSPDDIVMEMIVEFIRKQLGRVVTGPTNV